MEWWSVSPPSQIRCWPIALYGHLFQRVGTGWVSGPAYSCGGYICTQYIWICVDTFVQNTFGYICTHYIGRSCSHTLWGAAKKVAVLKWGLCHRWGPEFTFAATTQHNSSTCSMIIIDISIIQYITRQQMRRVGNSWKRPWITPKEPFEECNWIMDYLRRKALIQFLFWYKEGCKFQTDIIFVRYQVDDSLRYIRVLQVSDKYHVCEI